VEIKGAALAAESIPSEVASLDAVGVIMWANAAWLAAAQSESYLLAGCAVGTDFLGACRELGTAVALAVASGIAAVIAGKVRRFDHEVTSGELRWRFQASPIRGATQPGAVVMRSDMTGRAPYALWDISDPADLPERVARLTPREREVLQLMVQGLNNREIAAELGVAYTTVRSHAQAVIEKLAARSRLQAVALAYSAGLGAHS
jgi:DNA-binding NarL/FixJ family response regulator